MRKIMTVESFKQGQALKRIVDILRGLEVHMGKEMAIMGRVVALRSMGKVGFADVDDGDGRLQLWWKFEEHGEETQGVLQQLGIGDHVGVTGELFRTKTGEPSIHVRTLVPLSKALHTIPLGKEKNGQHWYGLTDIEQRYRHRHLDLITNKSARAVLKGRSAIINSVRSYLDFLGYLEVETPTLQNSASGASSSPFTTHYNAYDVDVRLRISPELYLKRLICGDIPKVYEMARCFRNEGVSSHHNPEFTLLEFYEAGEDMDGMMDIVEGMFEHVVYKGCLSPKTETGEALNFDQSWNRIDLLSSIADTFSIPVESLSTIEDARKVLGGKNLTNPNTGKKVELEEEYCLGGLLEKILDVWIAPTLLQPTFVTGFPLETSPLAREDTSRPGIVRRFEGYILGMEICNGYSELNDPVEQRRRMEIQGVVDEEFLYALECGMPSTGGCGIGIDRMVMVLLGARSIKDVMYFPFMKT